jgi:hypothetical protein
MSNQPDQTVGGSAQLMEVTPWLARQWLGQNKGNRPRKIRAIEAYSRDMVAGEWLISGEPIKFATDGRLIDGQNRLHAVILSDVSIKSWVMFGLDPRAQDVMDAGVKRSNADQLALHDVPHAVTVSTVAAAWTGWHDGRWVNASGSVGSPQLTHSETLQFVADHPEVVGAASMAKRTSKVLRLPAGVIGAAWMILAKIDEADATSFFRKIHDGETTGRGDPLLTLIRKAQSDRDQDRASRPASSFYLIFRAWNAWRQAKPLERLHLLNSNGDPVAIPTPR